MKDVKQISGLKRFWDEERESAPVYAGAFFQAFCGTVWLVAMPFVIKRLGGTDFDAGLCLGLLFGGYMTALAMCLLSRDILDRFNKKQMAQLGAGAITAAMTAGFITVAAAERGICGGKTAMITLIALSTAQGAATVLFWPVLVGWLSTSHEGRQLNRRLGIFNVSWSLGGVASPWFAGYLVKGSSISPLITCVAVAAMSLMSVSLARKPSSQNLLPPEDNGISDNAAQILRRRFRWMSRTALFTSFVCSGLLRTHLGLLMKFNLGFSESSYGKAFMIMSAAIFAALFAAGKTHRWHHKLPVFMGTQGLLLASMLMIVGGNLLWQFFLAAAIAGVAQGFLYSSHLYYVVSGEKNRSVRMAIHEITLSIGFLVGSIAGGYISDQFGRFAPYWFGLAVVAAGVVLQGGIWLWCANKPNSGEPKTCGG